MRTGSSPKLQDGYDTKVGERERGVGAPFGGQKQRISIARAFLANPTIRPSGMSRRSSVEPDSEAAIIAALDRLMQNRTTVLTSHRPSLIKPGGLGLRDRGRACDGNRVRPLISRAMGMVRAVLSGRRRRRCPRAKASS